MVGGCTLALERGAREGDEALRDDIVAAGLPGEPACVGALQRQDGGVAQQIAHSRAHADRPR